MTMWFLIFLVNYASYLSINQFQFRFISLHTTKKWKIDNIVIVIVYRYSVIFCLFHITYSVVIYPEKNLKKETNCQCHCHIDIKQLVSCWFSGGIFIFRIIKLNISKIEINHCCLKFKNTIMATHNKTLNVLASKLGLGEDEKVIK